MLRNFTQLLGTLEIKSGGVEDMHFFLIRNLFSLLYPGVTLAWAHGTYTMVFITKETRKVLSVLHEGKQ